MTGPLALSVLTAFILQHVAADNYAAAVVTQDAAAVHQSAPVRLQVGGEDATVVKHVDGGSKTSQIDLQSATPAVVMGLPPSAVSLGVQGAERHHIRAHVKGAAVSSMKMLVGQLPADGTFRGLKQVGSRRTRGESFDKVAEEAYTFMMQWKLVAMILLGCLVTTFLLAPLFGCLGMMCNISFVSLIMAQAGYGKEKIGETSSTA